MDDVDVFPGRAGTAQVQRRYFAVTALDPRLPAV